MQKRGWRLAASGVRTDYNVPADEVCAVLELVADNQGLHQAEIGFDLASWVILIALGGALYLAFSPHHRLLALLGTLGLAAGGIILAIHDIFWFVFPSVAKDFVSASGSQAEALQAIGRDHLSGLGHFRLWCFDDSEQSRADTAGGAVNQDTLASLYLGTAV